MSLKDDLPVKNSEVNNAIAFEATFALHGRKFVGYDFFFNYDHRYRLQEGDFDESVQMLFKRLKNRCVMG